MHKFAQRKCPVALKRRAEVEEQLRRAEREARAAQHRRTGARADQEDCTQAVGEGWFDEEEEPWKAPPEEVGREQAEEEVDLEPYSEEEGEEGQNDEEVPQDMAGEEPPQEEMACEEGPPQELDFEEEDPPEAQKEEELPSLVTPAKRRRLLAEHRQQERQAATAARQATRRGFAEVATCRRATQQKEAMATSCLEEPPAAAWWTSRVHATDRLALAGGITFCTVCGLSGRAWADNLTLGLACRVPCFGAALRYLRRTRDSLLRGQLPRRKDSWADGLTASLGPTRRVWAVRGRSAPKVLPLGAP